MEQTSERVQPVAAGETAQPGRLARIWGTRCGPVVYDSFVQLAELRGMSGLRRDIVGRAHGRVLELGAGTGLNLRHYRSGLEELILTEPEPGMAKRLERRAARTATAGSRVLRVPAEKLPFAAGSFDAVVATLVFCTVADPAAALREARRVLRDGGQLLFIEHVRASAGSRLERWQRRLRSPWCTFAYGCRCDQDTMSLIEHAGFVLTDCQPGHWRAMPAIVRPLICGQAQAA